MDLLLDWHIGLGGPELVALDQVETAEGNRALGSVIWRGIEGVEVLVNLVLLPGAAVGADVVTVRTAGSGLGKPAVTGADLRAIPLAKIAAYVQTRALELASGGPDDDRGRPARVMEDMAPDAIEAMQSIPATRRGRPAHDPAFLQRVAQVSLRLQDDEQAKERSGSVRRAVAAHFTKELKLHVSDSTVRDWWRAARKAHFLGPAAGPGARIITPGPRLDVKDPS